MCYWELTTFTGKTELKKWKPQAERNDDGFGYYCIQCKEHFKTLRYNKFMQKMKTHKKHMVLIHFRLKSCGKVTLHNVQPIIIGEYVVVHNGDFSTYAEAIDWRGLMPLGFSDSWILALELAEAWEKETMDEYTVKDKNGKDVIEKMARIITNEQRANIVLAKMKEISPKDFIANYLFISPTHVVASIGAGDFNDTKDKFFISSGEWQSAQMIYKNKDLLAGTDLPVLFTQQDYSKMKVSYHGYGGYDWTGETLIKRGDKWVTLDDDDDYWKRHEPAPNQVEAHWTDEVDPMLTKNEFGEVLFKVTAESMASVTFSDHLQLDEYLKNKLYDDIDNIFEISALKLWFDELLSEYELTTETKFVEHLSDINELPYYEEVDVDLNIDGGLQALFGDKGE